MNTSYNLIALGLLLNIAGSAFVWPLFNIAGFIVMTIGVFPIAKMEKPFRTLRNLSIIAIPFSILSLAILLTNNSGMQHTINCVVIGINIFFIIYNSYYFTAGINSYAKTINKMASARNSMTSWTLFGITIFLYFMAYSSLIEIVVLALRIILLAFGIYYVYALYNIGRSLFEKN